MKKERLDILLVEQGFADSREKAKAIIMTGKVLVNDEPEDKPGKKVDITAEIRYKGKQLKYVSRGGYKLEKAIAEFELNLEGKVCFDIGASTGGFTDCMLQNGAVKVYSIDVGTNQLAWKLRSDERVVSMEKTNVRYLDDTMISEKADFASFDVSFISLTKVIMPVSNLLKDEGQMVCLIKPQFEAGREKVGKKGVVREEKTHVEVIENIIEFLSENGLYLNRIDYSPIKGPEGNIEYVSLVSKVDTGLELDVKLFVKNTFKELKEKVDEV
ncbi:MAG: TlyA family RNA methyltransferase [Clostridia bacterium]|jgi:23S rRNA (cytidine1920-2'-O)/16S rRNA (cytidine1409-2'-O)-methyltransferase|nr:TlyA family RNA methyltransferase [Clostridia bacterium]